MKTYLKKLIFFGLPLTITAFCLVTAKADQLCDGDRYWAYGFPFLWTTPGPTSLSTTVDLPAAMFDLAVYFAVFAVICSTGLFDHFTTGRKAFMSVAFWLVAVLAGGGFGVVMSLDVQMAGIVNQPCEQKDYRLHVGFPVGR